MIKSTKTIYVCPNHCGVPLTTECEVTQEWLVDVAGNPVKLESSEEPCMLYNEPVCSKCKANAREYDCRVIPVWADSEHLLTYAYIPTDDTRRAFVMNDDEISVRHIEMVRRRDADCLVIDGNDYLLSDDGFYPRCELPGQESLREF